MTTKKDTNNGGVVPTNQNKRKPTAKKEHSLNDFKKEYGYDKSVRFKPKRWLPIENVLGKRTFMEATGLNGLLANEVTQVYGHTDTGKSLLSGEVAYSCQKHNILPVFIITELKFSWDHLKIMGFEFDEVVDENTGEITYEGEFLYIDRSQFNTIEEMSNVIMRLLDHQKNRNLQRDLCFIIDSIGTIQSDLSESSSKQNNEWDAGAISRTFGKGVIPRINLCKKDNYPNDNWLLIINQVWVRKPDSPVGKPKLATKGGDTIPFNSTIRIQFGNITNSGTSLLKVKKNNKEIVYATRTKIGVQKNHESGISLTTKLVATPHGFIEDSANDVIAKQYFKDHADMFLKILGGDINDIEFTVENNEAEDNNFKTYEIIDNKAIEVADE